MNRLTQEALAQRIGVNKMTISLYENDKRKPDEKMLPRSGYPAGLGTQTAENTL